MKIIYKPNNKIVLQIKPENKEDQSILIQYIQSLKEEFVSLNSSNS